MGKVLSTALRPIKTFNIENRAHRLISKPKHKPAPHHPSDEQNLKQLLKENPEIVEKLSRKDGALHDRLKDVYVASFDPKLEEKLITKDPNKPLPLNRTTPEEHEMGIEEPNTVTPGFITIRGALSLINDHKNHPKLSTGISAKRYNLTEDSVCKLIKYYGAFDLRMPKHQGKDPKSKLYMKNVGMRQISEN